ncbi:MAG: LacI family DNA-binding transcriptional regulator [Acholeplasmataceae bacterium]|nr:LacI family DNA-binding transcriptional regulator [Acholeplasmataceae bacterium]
MAEKRTIYTIAKDLGLAPSTVSKIINHKGSIQAQTRDRVLSYIKEVGYVPTSSARRLKSKKSYTVGVVFTEEADVGLEHSFFSSILQHFKKYLEHEGYELSFIVKKLGQHEMSYLEWCYNKQVDGVYIVVGNYDDQGLIDLIHSDIPCVSTDMELAGLTSIIGNNEEGIKQILDFIRNKLMKTKVSMIAGPQSSKAFIDRLNVFKEYAKTYNISYEDKHIVIAESFGFTSGYQACEQLIRKNHLNDVLIVGSDDLALGALKALKDHAIDVPQHVQVIGYDDIHYAKHFSPPLTTIRQDRKILGETAAKSLIALMENGTNITHEVIKIPVQLVVRESTINKV